MLLDFHIIKKNSLAIFCICFVLQECYDIQTCLRFVWGAFVIGFTKPKFMVPLKGRSHPHMALFFSGCVFPSPLWC